MTAREQLVAYCATLAALVVIYIAALITGALSPAVLGKIEAFALGTLTGGLIGVLRMPSTRSVTIDNQPTNPVPTEDAR